MDISEQPLPCLTVSSCKVQRSAVEPEDCRVRASPHEQEVLCSNPTSKDRVWTVHRPEPELCMSQIWSPPFRGGCDCESIYVPCKMVRVLPQGKSGTKACIKSTTSLLPERSSQQAMQSDRSLVCLFW